MAQPTIFILTALVLAVVSAFEPHATQEFMKAENAENPVAQVPVVGQQFAVNPVSTSLQCVISLTIQFFVLYTALAIGRSVADAFGMKYKNHPVEQVLRAACMTVMMAPMLAILFLACRMRVTQLTRGQGNPPEWVQVSMYFSTYSLLLTTIVVCVIPLFTGEVIGVDPKTGDLAHDAQPFQNRAAAIAFTVVKYACMLCLYGGALAVVVGIITYVPPAGIWPDGKLFPVAPAVMCTVILACQFFLVYGALQIARTFTQLSGMRFSKLEDALMTATHSVNLAPMLAVLFIAARMRALHLDPLNGNPQKWAQTCFFMCTYALIVQTILTVLVPVVLQGDAKSGQTEGDVEYVVENKMLGTILTIGRYLIMLCIYIGFSCVIWSIFTIEHPKGPDYTPPIAVTMQCVINLTVQFFFVYLMIWICITIREFTGYELTLLTQTMENARGTVMFCPMMAILFVGTRMRALLLTDNRGAPQGWAQDGMYMATWSMLIQFTMILLTPLATGTPGKVDEDGNIKWEPENRILFYCVSIIRWLGFILLYGGIITVITAVYMMTPETANGRGAVPIIGDGKVPGAGADIPGYGGIEEPVGPNDFPGVPN
jgi:hypothetical protein